MTAREHRDRPEEPRFDAELENAKRLKKLVALTCGMILWLLVVIIMILWRGCSFDQGTEALGLLILFLLPLVPWLAYKVI